MDDLNYQTKYLSVMFYPGGKVRITSDGWVECGDYSRDETNELLLSLSNEGWVLVGSCDHRCKEGTLESMDLYFRREVE
jgi:hypothetical protein